MTAGSRLIACSISGIQVLVEIPSIAKSMAATPSLRLTKTERSLASIIVLSKDDSTLGQIVANTVALRLNHQIPRSGWNAC